jgi:hypothetical protein
MQSFDKPTIKGAGLTAKLTRLSPRVAALLMLRCHSIDATLVFEAALKSYSGQDPRILSIATQMAVTRTFRNPIEWKTTLPLIRRAYRIDAMSDLALLRVEPDDVNMPLPVASEISRQAKSYPLLLVDLADASLTKAVGLRAKQVGLVAKNEQWFWAGVDGGR